MKKLFFISLLGLMVIGSMGLATNTCSRAPAEHPAPQPSRPTIFAVGRVEGSTAEIELRPELAGRIQEVLVREGQLVEQGQMLMRLDDRQARQEVALAEAELALAESKLERLNNGAHQQQRVEAAALLEAKQAELERAKADWKRAQSLLRERVISQQDGDNQRARLLSSIKEAEAANARVELLNSPPRADEVRIDQANIRAAQARLELAKVHLEHTQLRSPRSGQVLRAEIHAGEITGPASAEPAVVLADTSHFQVRAFVEELDAPRVRQGMKAVATAEGVPGRQMHGRLGRLSPRMTRKELSSDRPNERFDTKMREVWIELEDPGPLVVGLRVDVLIEINDPPAAPATS
jgi:multidrug resistance efflux pump